MFSVNVSVDAKKTLAQLSRIEKQQWPFALALALTRTATDSQMATQLQTRIAFKLRSDFVVRGIRMAPASKSDIQRFGLAISDVHTAPRISSFMPIHEPGGTRLPVARGSGVDKGRSLVYPGHDLPSSYRTARGAVKERWKPANLLKGYRTGARGKSRGKQIRVGKKSQGRAFIIRSRKGTPMIARRKGSARLPIEVLYVLFNEAQINARWKFEQTVTTTARRRFPHRLGAAMQQALKG